MTENQKLREAEQALLKRYAELVNSGDAGNWYQEAELEVIAARQALALPPDVPETNFGKLREALQAIANIDDATNHSVDASAALDRIGQIARQALALPTAAPVGERLTLPAEDVHAAFVKHFPKSRISQAWINFAAEIAEAMQARAALSARKPLTSEQVKALKGEYGYSLAPVQAQADFINGIRCGEKAHGIDAAMRKDKL